MENLLAGVPSAQLEEHHTDAWQLHTRIRTEHRGTLLASVPLLVDTIGIQDY
jgi:hypothetical protein